MRVHNEEIKISKDQKLTFEYLDALTREYSETAIRFVVCGSDKKAPVPGGRFTGHR